MFKNVTRTKLLDLALFIAVLSVGAQFLFWPLESGSEHEGSAAASLKFGNLVLSALLLVTLLVYRLRSKQVSEMGAALDHAANLSGVGYLHYFPQQGCWSANHIAQALLRRSTSEFSASLDEVLQRVHPDDLESAAAAAKSALEGSDPVSGVVRLGDSESGYALIRFHAYRLLDYSLSISLLDIDHESEARRIAARNEMRLHEALKAARATRFEVDLESGRIVAPASARELIGLEPDGGLDELITCVDEEYRDDLQLRFEQRASFENLYAVTREDGSKRWLRFTANLEPEAQMNLTLVDLTEQKEVEFEQRNSLIQIQAATRVAKLSIYNEHLQTGELLTIYQNPKQQFDFVGGEKLLLRTPSQHHAAIEEANTDLGKVIEIPYVDDQGTQLSLRYSVIAQDSTMRTILIQDVTDLAQQRKSLQDSLDEMDRVRLDLQRRAERERQMFAVIGHELRTPAASIKMLLQEFDAKDESQQAQTLLEQTDHLLDVLDDIRILVNPDRVYQSEEQMLPLKPIVERAIQALQPLLHEARLQVSLAADEGADRQYRLNPQLLRQLVLNLIRNACFHSGARVMNVTIRTREIDQMSSKVILRFEDNGQGVPESFKDKLFQPFHRADNESQGMGLGLSICETLTKTLHGNIRYEDSPGGGATFVVEFQLTPADLLLGDATAVTSTDSTEQVVAVNAVEEPVKQPFDWETLNILLAEDNATIRMLTQKMLEKRGAKVITGADGALALSAFEQAQINFVLTDIFMPNMDGYELTTALRQRDFTGPIVGISAAVVGEETEQLVETGADSVLSKPIDMDVLEGVIQSLAERIQSLDGPA